MAFQFELINSEAIGSRPILDPARIHPAIRDTIANHHRDLVDEVEAAIAAYPVVMFDSGEAAGLRA